MYTNAIRLYTIQYNIRLIKKIPADTAATEITKRRIVKAVKTASLPSLVWMNTSQPVFSVFLFIYLILNCQCHCVNIKPINIFMFLLSIKRILID